ncbi:hypothetical protein [Streptomyces rimosus]|uniref:hypothetical protein n=1 Tax=Streptomyces rimosus TaxID=1927 RepID=UPI000A8A7169|nr:hypothetical protein [Streptomyces rimosus]
MAQYVGYLMAAAGPLLLGILHDSTGSWTLPLVVLVALGAARAAAGTAQGATAWCAVRHADEAVRSALPPQHDDSPT